MAQPQRGPKDDTLRKLVLNDFSGGINVYKGPFALNSNESPGMLNVIPFVGRLQSRGGWTPFSSLPFPSDEAYQFYDNEGGNHYAVWAGGNLYDCHNGVPVLIASAVYTAGQQIGRVSLNGILYWSTKTISIQQWDPVTMTVGPIPMNGISPAPATPYLMTYTNALVAVGVNFTPPGEDTYQGNVFSWSAINDPTSWNAANSQVVGPNNGGELSFAIQFGIADIGVAPFRNLIVGRTDQGIYSYTGALGALIENVINCPVGCLDPASVQYLPTAQAFGSLIFLGTDYQFWSTNGITANVISLNILPILSPALQTAILNNANQRFRSGYNEKWQYYFCDIAGTQFVYKWDTGAWSEFTGWPSGPVFVPQQGVPQLYVASADADVPYLAKIAIDTAGDNGVAPAMYWKSAWLHCGDFGRFKEFNWVDPVFFNSGTTYSVNAITMLRADGTQLASRELRFNTPNNALPTNPFILDVSVLDGPDVLGGNEAASFGTGNPILNIGRLSASATGTGVMRNYQGSQQLQGVAVQFTVAYASGSIDFEMIGMEVRYCEKGYLRDGGLNYNPQGGIAGTDPIIGPNP